MHQYKGKLIIHTGSMFSGKTSSLERDIKRFNIAGYKTVCFKPDADVRYSESEIVTHNMSKLEAFAISDIDRLISIVEELHPDIIGIDEAQFLKGDINLIKTAIFDFLAKGITVVVAGLDMDFSAEPFEVMKELMPIADYVNKHHAVCTRCGTDAWVSHRLISSKERIVLGAKDEYEPLCRSCYNEIRREEELLVNKNQVKLDL